MTRCLLRNMLALDPTLASFFDASPLELSHHLNLSLEKANQLIMLMKGYKQHNHSSTKNNLIQTITCIDNIYPELLKHIPDPPLVLYAIGNIELLRQQPAISVIGTRKPSQEGYQKTEHIIKPLIEANWIIVSGLAYGIDRFAHEITVANNGRTIAVLGSGFHHIYPQAHIPLAKKIITNGLLLSEYPPYMQARKYHFPERNRIISGLTEATLVIEATERSGTCITVDQALEQGKDVYAVPGSIFQPQSVGCHRLIQEGAKLIFHAKDILECYSNRNEKID